MAERSKIEWTDHTFNPWTGCTKVSAACDHCYAEGWAKRSGHVEWGPHSARRRTKPGNWNGPLKWNAEARDKGIRYRVFCASLADVFDNHKSIEWEWRHALLDLILRTTHLDWLLLTKRPQNVARYVPGWWNCWPAHVWIGTTVENQEEAERRIPHLLSIPAKVRFLSCEPLLGPVDLRELHSGWHFTNCLDGYRYHDTDRAVPSQKCERINWVICGGESGPGARPMHPDWARSLRDQCAAAGVPFFFKQWGEWGPCDHLDEDVDGMQFGCFDDAGRWVYPVQQEWASQGRQIMYRASKKRAGRLLDGREWNEVPGLMVIAAKKETSDG